MDNHWAVEYIGKPWRPKARGPDAFDCWGLLWFVYRKHFGVELPEFPGVDSADTLAVMDAIETGLRLFSSDWTRIQKPVAHCGVAMGRVSRIHHVGVFLPLDGGNILHATDRGQVILSTVRELRTHFRRIEFYQHKDLL